jgi:O-methyltransferase domain
VTLGVPDLLGEGDRSVAELAEATGSDEDSLYRLLRALAGLGVLHEDDGRRFSLTELGEPLRSDVPGSLAGWAAMIGRPQYWSAWGNLVHSARTGENAFRTVHGTDVWSYRASRPDENEIFDRAMIALTRGTNEAFLDAYDFGRFGVVVDVGGGRGALLAALLSAYPSMQGVLFDQEHVVQLAGEVFESAGVADRCKLVAGSFFDGVPEGGDAYVLKSVIHDWEDEEALAILRRCREAVSADAVLILLERDLGAPNAAFAAKLSDLNMLVAPGGRERSIDEYAALFEGSGFRLVESRPTATGHLVIEAQPL